MLSKASTRPASPQQTLIPPPALSKLLGTRRSTVERAACSSGWEGRHLNHDVRERIGRADRVVCSDH
jgi:hypothetical protein